jgi:hypothetical protein
MKHINTILFTILLFAVSCSKNENDSEDHCTAPGPASASTNAPVNFGDTLRLMATPVSEATGYSWTGPTGFTSSSLNPVIINATPAHSGTYYVRALSGSCQSEADSVEVTVSSTIPCAPFTNQVNLSGVAAVAVSFVSSAVENDQYKITANGSNGDVRIYFGTATQPVTGIYALKNSSSFLTATQAAVIVTSSPSYWQNSSGILYVTVTSGKVSASFCDIPFSESTFGWNTTAFGNITEQ